MDAMQTDQTQMHIKFGFAPFVSKEIQNLESADRIVMLALWSFLWSLWSPFAVAKDKFCEQMTWLF